MIERILQKKYQNFLALVDIEINGERPWDLQIHNSKLFTKVMLNGSLGFGEAYMNEWFDCERLDIFFDKILSSGIYKDIGGIPKVIGNIKSKFRNLQSVPRAFQVAEHHYDIGNDLFSIMLDKTMMYTCGYWSKEVKTLEQSQIAKLDLVGRKLDLKKGMKVLDIGCGWGGAAKYFAKNYGVSVVGITISEEQASYAKKQCEDSEVEIRLVDYRKINEKFDAIYSIGMFEAVGYKNYKTFFKTVNKCLNKDGSFLLHTIGSDISTTHTDPWVEKYIFPNGMMPSPKQITKACEGFFAIDDWHNLDKDYDKTIMCWYENFTKNYKLIKEKYDKRFYRMWTYWLLTSAASFRCRSNRLWQILFSNEGSRKNITTYSYR